MENSILANYENRDSLIKVRVTKSRHFFECNPDKH